MACRGRDPRACDTGTDLDRGDPRADCKIGGLRERFFLPADLPAVHQLGVCADRIDAGAVRAFAENQPVTSIVDAIRALLSNQPVGNDIWIALAWCVGILIVAYGFAMLIYKRKAA